MYIFVSHSSKNSEIAERVCDLIEENGHKCFLAPRDIRTGHEYAEEIVAGIERSDAVLLLLSKEANSSPHVLREIERAVSKHITIMVYKLEEVELTKSLEYFLMMHQWVNAKPGLNYREILKAIEELADREKQDNSVPKTSGRKMPVWLIACACVLLVLCIGVGVFGYYGGFFGGMEEVVEVSLGDTILFGNYNGEPIKWRVLKVSEDGRSAVVIAQDILCMKAFDAAESGKYNCYGDKNYWGADISGESEELQRLLRGDNRWSTSNIRTWLNSSAENVKYEDGAPSAAAMSSLMNGYDTEPGFLSEFSDEELGAIVVTTVDTDGVITEDRVYLLSREELDLFETADVKLTAKPTTVAGEQDKTDWYELYSLDYGVEDYYWWLRDGDETDSSKAYMVCNSYVEEETISKNVGLEGFGIRPAMTVDLTSGCIVVE